MAQLLVANAPLADSAQKHQRGKLDLERALALNQMQQYRHRCSQSTNKEQWIYETHISIRSAAMEGPTDANRNAPGIFLLSVFIGG